MRTPFPHLLMVMDQHFAEQQDKQKWSVEKTNELLATHGWTRQEYTDSLRNVAFQQGQVKRSRR